MKTYDRTNWLKSPYPRLGILICYLFIAFKGASQETERNPYIFTKNRFTINLSNGGNRSDFDPTTGDQTPKESLGLVHQLDFDYTFALGRKFGISIGTGFGAFPFVYRLQADQDFSGTDGDAYYDLVDYNLFSHLNTGVNYQHWIGDKYALFGQLGGGLMRPAEWGIEITSGQGGGMIYGFDFDYEGVKPFFDFKVGIDKVLKNDNLLGFSLGYRYITQPVYEGDYTLYYNYSVGEMKNKPHTFDLSIGYSFTQAKKMKYADQFFVEDEVSVRDARKKYRKEKRYINPKSVFVGVRGGLFLGKNNTEDNAPYLLEASIPSWMIGATGEIGIGKNIFIQMDAELAYYWSAIVVNDPEGFGFGAGSGEFYSPAISAGLGYRLIGPKNNINYLNASAGLGFGVNTEKKGEIGSGGIEVSNPQTGEGYSLTHKDYSVRYIMPRLYLNLSRDFQLTKSFYFVFDYRFNWGMLNAMEQHVEYQDTDNPGVSNETIVAIRGTSNSFQFGFKYKFVPKKHGN